MSAAGTRTFIGGEVSSPMLLIRPDTACTMPSTPGLSRHGPLWPYAETEQNTTRGLIADSAA